ncbi:hypothetical protein LSAT2_011259 [Lamellibrachia satsuma]|nr:hypothetical protein LSAT2_011259 [Lamellibrachia satsuma]
MSQLQVLQLDHCDLTPESLTPITDGLLRQGGKSLESLNLSGNKVFASVEAGRSLGAALAATSGLCQLDLNGCGLTSESFEHIVDGLKAGCPMMVHFKCADNSITDDVEMMLRDLMIRLPQLKMNLWNSGVSEKCFYRLNKEFGDRISMPAEQQPVAEAAEQQPAVEQTPAEEQHRVLKRLFAEKRHPVVKRQPAEEQQLAVAKEQQRSEEQQLGEERQPVAEANKPSSPSNLQVVVCTDYICVKWQAPMSDGNSPITRYVLEKADARTPNFTTAGHTNTDTLEFKMSQLNKGKHYFLRVFAENVIGQSEPICLQEPVRVPLAQTLNETTGALGVWDHCRPLMRPLGHWQYGLTADP